MFSSVSQTRIEPIGKPRRTLSSSALSSGLLPHEGSLKSRDADLAGGDALHQLAQEDDLRNDFGVFLDAGHAYNSRRINSMPRLRSPRPRVSSSFRTSRTCQRFQHSCTLFPNPSARISWSVSVRSSNRSPSIAEVAPLQTVLHVEEVLLIIAEPTPRFEPLLVLGAGVGPRVEENARQVILRFSRLASTQQGRPCSLQVLLSPLGRLALRTSGTFPVAVDDGDQPRTIRSAARPFLHFQPHFTATGPELTKRIGSPSRRQRPRRDLSSSVTIRLTNAPSLFLFSTRIIKGSSAKRQACSGASSSAAAGAAVTRTCRPCGASVQALR